MNKVTKIIIGFLTFLPLLIFLSAGGYVFFQIASIMFSEDSYMPMLLLSYFSYVIPFLFIFGLLNLALILFYLVHIGRNQFLDTEKKFLWIVIIIVLNTISMPIYWYVHLWNEEAEEQNPAIQQPHESPGTESPEF